MLGGRLCASRRASLFWRLPGCISEAICIVVSGQVKQLVSVSVCVSVYENFRPCVNHLSGQLWQLFLRVSVFISVFYRIAHYLN